MKRKKIYQRGGTKITSATSGMFIPIDNLSTDDELKGISIANLYASLGITIENLIVATETSIASFAAASAGYTFDERDLIQLAADAEGNVLIYTFLGGTKTDVNQYVKIDFSKIDWLNVINKPISWNIVAPTANDDTTGGYSVGDVWIDSVLQRIYIASDVTAASAVWNDISAWANIIDLPITFNATAPTVNDDDTQGFVVGDLWIARDTQKFYTVSDVTTGAAVWILLVPEFASEAEVLARTETGKAISPATLDGGVKRYKALISQSGTNDPTVVTLQNNFGVSPIIDRGSVGEYGLNFAGINFENGTFNASINKNILAHTANDLKRIDLFDDGDGFAGILTLQTFIVVPGVSTTKTDGLLDGQEIIIELYP